MPPRKSTKKRSTKGKKTMRKARVPRSLGMTGQTARVKELCLIPTACIQGNNTSAGANADLLSRNVGYNLSLQGFYGFPRASNVAQLFQEYRITRVKVTIYPVSNTIVSGAPTSIIRCFTKEYDTPWRDFQGSTNVFSPTLQELRALNPKHFLLTQKPVTRTFKPTVSIQTNSDPLLASSTTGNRSYEVQKSPWLSTQSYGNNTGGSAQINSIDNTVHRGLWMYFEDAVASTSRDAGAQFDIEADFEYRKPAVLGEYTPATS